VGKAIYAIDAFPDDAQLWRIEWIGAAVFVGLFRILAVISASMSLLTLGSMVQFPDPCTGAPCVPPRYALKSGFDFFGIHN